MIEEATEVCVVGVGVTDVDVDEEVVLGAEMVVGVVSADVKVVGSGVVVGAADVVGPALVVSEVRVVGTGPEPVVVGTVSAVLAVVPGAKEVGVVSARVLVSVSAGVLVGVADGSDVADSVVAEETVAAVSPVLREVALVLLADMINNGLYVNWVDAGLEVGAMLAVLQDEKIHGTWWDSALEGTLRRRKGEAGQDKVATCCRSTGKTVLKREKAWWMIRIVWTKRAQVHMVKQQSRE
jgi:hypothetical protein